MKRRSFYVFLAASLAMLIPAPGRFVFGFILSVELILIMLCGTIANVAFIKLKLDEMASFASMFVVIGVTILYKQLLNFLIPEAALALGFVIYLLPVSIFFVGYLYSNNEGALAQRLRVNMVHTLTFALYALLFFLFRDILGFGTITFFNANHQIVEKIIIPADKLGILTILASIPGALLMSSFVLFHHIIFRNKINIVRNSEAAE